MNTDTIYKRLDTLAESLQGDLKYDTITRTIYSTDASAYKEMPLAVIWPEGKEDLKKNKARRGLPHQAPNPGS